MRFPLFFLLLLICYLGSSQDHPTDSIISFIQNDWKKAKKLAEISGKTIFIDGYTVWCGPCKLMDQNVFTEAKVGQFFNAHFINLKLDFEKGDGVNIARKYQVVGYPTFLFLSPEGILLHKGMGYMPPDTFLLLGKKAAAPQTKILAFRSEYERGNHTSDLLYQYAKVLAGVNDTLAYKISRKYLEDTQNWASNKALLMVVLSSQTFKDVYFNYMVEKRYLFVKEFGEGVVDGKLVQMIEDHLFVNLDDLNLEDAQIIFNESFPSRKAAPLFDRFEINYWDRKQRREKYIEKTRDFVKKYSSLSWSTLNGLAWEFYEKVTDPKALTWAIKWAKKSISLNSNHFNTDTLAALYYKTGKQKAALKWAEKSVAMAEAAGADHQETNVLLEKIKKM